MDYPKPKRVKFFLPSPLSCTRASRDHEVASPLFFA